MHPHNYLLALLAFYPLQQSAIAGENQHIQLEAHLHGSAELNLVIEGKQVALELATPANNLLGFEYQPKTTADKQKLEQALEILNQGSWIQLSKTARCQLSSTATEFSLVSEKHDYQRHSEHHEAHHDEPHQEHEENHSDSTHSEFHISYEYHCDQPDSLDGAKLNLWQQFDGFEQIRAQLITPNGQKLIKLTNSSPEITF